MAQAAWAHRAGAQQCPALGHLLPSLFGLAPCGVYHASGITAGAVRSYRTFSPLLQLGAPGLDFETWENTAEAVFSLWHWPSTGLETRIPDVIRHTALRSSDFPPPDAPRFHAKCPAATARSSCQYLVYLESNIYGAVWSSG